MNTKKIGPVTDLWHVLVILGYGRPMTTQEILKRTGMPSERMMCVLEEGAERGFLEKIVDKWRPGGWMREYGENWRGYHQAEWISLYVKNTIRDALQEHSQLRGIEESSTCADRKSLIINNHPS